MYCISCGTKLDDDAKFCTNCGMSIDQYGKENIQNDDQIRNQPIGKVVFHMFKESAILGASIFVPYFAILLILFWLFLAGLVGNAFYSWLSLLPIVVGSGCFVFVTAFVEEWYYYCLRREKRGFNLFSFLRIAGIVIAIILSIHSCTSPSSKYIETVQKGHMDINQEETVEEVLESNFKHSKWKCYKNKSDEYVVQYEGNRDFTDVTIQFVVDPEDSSFYIDSIQVDGEKLNAIESATAVSLLFGE